jgi:acyl-CoA reductase-like NAD-dependent aldehyde dehydrogenase
VKLYVDAMDAVVVEVSADGRVRLENEEWSRPTLQERRAILYAAGNAVDELKELIDILEADAVRTTDATNKKAPR